MPDAELVARVAQTAGLTRGEATRVVTDVVAYFHEQTETLVRRRHAELQADGLRNAEIFERIRAELSGRLVAPPDLSIRQLRRIIYG